MSAQGWWLEAFLRLRQFREQLFIDLTTIEFLKTRNATLTIRTPGSESFYVVRVSPLTNMGTPDTKFRFYIKVFKNQTLRVMVYDRTHRQLLVDVTLPVSSSAGSMNLELERIHLKMDIDEDLTPTRK